MNICEFLLPVVLGLNLAAPGMLLLTGKNQSETTISMTLWCLVLSFFFSRRVNPSFSHFHLLQSLPSAFNYIHSRSFGDLSFHLLLWRLKSLAEGSKMWAGVVVPRSATASLSASILCAHQGCRCWNCPGVWVLEGEQLLSGKTSNVENGCWGSHSCWEPPLSQLLRATTGSEPLPWHEGPVLCFFH